jgi:uncharacterized repeat protein (TIGR01451 family)
MRRRQRRPTFRPWLEHLEDRLAPATVQFNAASEIVNATDGSFSVPVTRIVVPAVFASGIASPNALTFDASGNLYVANGSTVSKVTPAGVVSTFASGFDSPDGLALGGGNNIFVADSGTNTVSEVTPAGVVSPFAARFDRPSGLAFDKAGNLYVANAGNNTVSKVTPAGVVSTFASGFISPDGLAFDAAGNLYVANLDPSRPGLSATIGKVTPAGLVSTFASGFEAPQGLAIDGIGNLYVADEFANTVDQVTPAGVVSTFADGFNSPTGLAFGPDGNFYVGNFGNSTVSQVIDNVIVNAPFTLGGTAVDGTDFTGVTASPLRFDPTQTTQDITGTLLPDPGASQTLTFTLGTPNNASVGSPTTNTLTIIEPNVVPTLASLSPNSATAGSPDTTVTLTGAGFVKGSTADFNGTAISTTFVSATELIAVIPAADLTTVGTDPITVVSPTPGGGTSAPQTFTVTVPAPTLTSVSPNSAGTGSPDTTVTLTGTNFVNGSTADFSGAPLSTTFVSATQLTAVIPAAALTTAFLYPITVVTPGPGGGTSAPQTFAVTPAAILSVTKTDSGNFFRGEIGATFTITVTNSGIAATNGTVSLADALPGAFTATAFSGTGWSVNLATLTATRTDVLPAGKSYPVLTLTVNVASSAPNSVTNEATASGGGAVVTNNDQAADTVTIGNPPLSITKTHSGSFFRGEIGATFTIVVTNTGATPTTGATTVVDGFPGGLTATAFAGSGWSVNLATFTATRTDALAAGASFPKLTLTVNVNANAPNNLTNVVHLSGDGIANVGSASDAVAISSPTLMVAKTHVGTFFKGEIGATFTITATNTGNVATNGTLNLSDQLPGAFTLMSFAGTGWTVNGFTATRTTALAAGQKSVLTMKVNVSATASGTFKNLVTLIGDGQTVNGSDTIQL